MKLFDIAAEISDYLRKFEADPIINAAKNSDNMLLPPFFHARAYDTHTTIHIVYVSYQGYIILSKKEAMAYLKWLRAGNVGTHRQALREMKNG